MDYLEKLQTGIVSGSNSVYSELSIILPKILISLIIFLVGYFVALWLKKITVKLLKKAKLNTLVSKTNLDEQLKEAGIKMDLPIFFGNFVKWVVYILTLLIIVDIFDLQAITDFLTKILEYVKNVVLGLIVFSITVYVARFTEAISEAVAKYIKVDNVDLVGKVTKGIIYFVGLLLFVHALKLDAIEVLIYQIITATTYGIALAFGLAFGLGGQDKVKEFLAGIKTGKKK